ncbi:hypothetical protein [Bacillus cihuensis]|uniref:hypothetical protein n=1 Tax=Bacillus cihuensis TaxID=1208599 RepID=UPI00040F0F7E|nr:hypothetical protein [Bacillus cihuensis]
MDDKCYITFGSQMGDRYSAEAEQPHLIELRLLLEKHCNKIYSPQLDEFAPILRVDGDIWFFEFEGCEKLRLYKKQRYITVDIGMPKSKWQNKSSIEIKKYLIDSLVEALNLFVKRIKKGSPIEDPFVIADKSLYVN